MAKIIVGYQGEVHPPPEKGPKMSSVSQRRRWLKVLDEEKGNVAAASRRLGISEQTLHRWKKRRGPELFRCKEPGCPAGPMGLTDAGLHALEPGHSVRPARRPAWVNRRPHPRPARTGFALLDLVEHDFANPRLPARVHHAVLLEKGHELSERNVRRMLREVRARCPVCGGRGGHKRDFHAWNLEKLRGDLETGRRRYLHG